jgi:hypothetical protein
LLGRTVAVSQETGIWGLAPMKESKKGRKRRRGEKRRGEEELTL